MPGVAPPTSGPQSEPAFVQRLSALTGLDPRVIEAWVKVEGAYAPNGTGGNNFLNIRESTSRSGVPITGVTSAGFAHFRTANDAATEAAAWINTMPNYAGIRRSIRLGPLSQLSAIAASPWDSGHYGGGRALYSSYRQLGGSGGGSGVLSTVERGIKDVGGAAQLYINPAQALPAIGDITSGVGNAVGLGGVGTAVKDAAQAPVAIANDIGATVGFLFNPQSWLRVGYILGGGVLVVGGLFILARSVGTASVASVAAGAARGGSSSPGPTQTRTKTVYIMDEEANRRERVRRRAAASPGPSDEIPF